MTDNDFIKRGDALSVAYDIGHNGAIDQIAALPAVTDPQIATPKQSGDPQVDTSYTGRIATLQATNARLVEALRDLMSWFPVKPSDPEWRIRGGEMGADDAVDHARAILAELEKK